MAFSNEDICSHLESEQEEHHEFERIQRIASEPSSRIVDAFSRAGNSHFEDVIPRVNAAAAAADFGLTIH